jgi:hypothetical protein
MLIDTAVWIGVETAEIEAQPIATECPLCFAIVRNSRLDRHTQVVHAGGQPRP